MGKNVIVLDEFENEIGQTYPKRARGLVRSGRAEYAGDCKIRLLGAHAPTSDFSENVEEIAMSVVINFNAREFQFDQSCEQNAGSRMFISDEICGNVEAFEIGDQKGAWSQIKAEKTLQVDTDYLFRFAMTGGYNDANDAVSQFIMVPDGCWEDRYVYQLSRSAYKPVLSKHNPSDGALLRVYEIPFQSGKHESWQFIFAAQHAAARFMPAGETDSYAGLADYTFDQWRQERTEQMKLEEAAGASGNGNPNIVLNLSGARLSGQALYNLLQKVERNDNVNIDLSGAWVGDGQDYCEAGRGNSYGGEDAEAEAESSCDDEESEAEAEDNSDNAVAMQQMGTKVAYEFMKLQYDSAPEGSEQKERLGAELIGLEGQLEELGEMC